MTDTKTDVIDERHSKFDFANGTVELRVKLLGTGEEDDARDIADVVLAMLLAKLSSCIILLTKAAEQAAMQDLAPNTEPLVLKQVVPMTDGVRAQVRLTLTLAEGACMQEVSFVDLGSRVADALAQANVALARRRMIQQSQGNLSDVFGGGEGLFAFLGDLTGFGGGHTHHHHV